MVKRYRRRVYRRRRIYRRPRVKRPLRLSKRPKFFKLREYQTVSSTVGSETTIVIYDNPNTAVNWTDFTDLFDSFRVCAVKLRWIPNMNVSELSLTQTAFQSPVFIAYDKNSFISTVPSKEQLIQYENLKIKRVLGNWSVYYRMQRNIPLNTSLTTSYGVSTRGYQPTNAPTASQTIMMRIPIMITGTTGSVQIAQVIATYYCCFKDPK